MRALTWIRTDARDNGYARPIEGLLTLIDLDTLRVVGVEDHGPVPLLPVPATLPPTVWPIRPTCRTSRAGRADLRPLEIRQPDGPSFVLTVTSSAGSSGICGVGFTAREGLVLHTVGYEDGGRVRPILYRASLSEMVVPYGYAAPTHWRQTPSTRARSASACSPTRSSSAATAWARSATWTRARPAPTDDLDDAERDLPARGGLRRSSGSTATAEPASPSRAVHAGS